MSKISIAWVEDSPETKDLAISFLRRYESEKRVSFDAHFFVSAEDFLSHYENQYQAVFMDVLLGEGKLDGMSAAAKLREIDDEVPLLFVTNMAKLVYKGYEVKAFDYILKPVTYPQFVMKMDRLMHEIVKGKAKNVIIITRSGMAVIDVNKLVYIEVVSHKITYHSLNGVLEVNDTLKNCLKTFAPYHFMQCNKCYLINPAFVKRIENYNLYIGDEVLLISHPRKKEFTEQFMDYVLGKGGEK